MSSNEEIGYGAFDVRKSVFADKKAAVAFVKEVPLPQSCVNSLL